MSNYHGYKPEKKIYLISKPVDFRLSINGLTAYVQEVLRVNVYGNIETSHCGS
ncbi:hypothetical protein ABB02_00157 [Clostridiaceae bacterium JG1575]|nr:hypothetical protein ABB02_00157 [Clostridiaceae bacterium JG1575]